MEILFSAVIIIFSIVIHEVSHGAMANILGDPTAKREGRLTLNPIKHIDPIGTIILPIFMILTVGKGIGWAKPVPVNPYNLRDQKYGSLKVAIAGPGANLLVALVFGLLIRFLLSLGFVSAGFYYMAGFTVLINIVLAIFNLIPIPPLDGSHILFTFLPGSMDRFKIFFSQFGFVVLIFLLFFFSSFFRFLSNFAELIFFFIVGARPF